MQGHNVDICYSCRTSLGVVFDLVLLFVKVVFPEEVVDRFVVLWIELEDRGRKKRDPRFREIGLPFGIPSLWTSFLRQRGKLGRRRVESFLQFLQSATTINWTFEDEKGKSLLDHPPS